MSSPMCERNLLLKIDSQSEPECCRPLRWSHSVHAPCFPPGFIEYVESNKVHVLGICYGLQLIVQQLGGEVRVGEKQEYGRMEIAVEKAVGLFGKKNIGDRQSVWMSHGDEAVKLPEGFEVVARSRQGAVAAVETPGRRFYGLQ
ncbi:UNVERIFIED_CONTAM: GMP synthase [glutamine-hydrolyzing] [Sesamum radiatum]|uniref:GMP synthase [glutamine-hydrolyzing] n=1 Tax=Sesamum radiatum TaxID=300843 RepID=A0AAW2L3I4_SESRA